MEDRSDCFEKLLDLQHPEIMAGKDTDLTLLPIGVLAKPFIQNFKYQFMSDKPTSMSARCCELYLLTV
jgi:hypothetical protein